VWRSPAGQPSWARPVLLGIAAAAALLYAWNITRAGYAPFYSVAVKSMSESWKAFLFGAFDPKATITIDKLAGSFLSQALSARIFGFHPRSLALPQVIEGVVCVLVMYRVVRRWAGVPAGLLAAGIFALTPPSAGAPKAGASPPAAASAPAGAAEPAVIWPSATPEELLGWR
jgi:4-amino-4-deoxy-L-arabinose transferase-like glycosyltransferase